MLTTWKPILSLILVLAGLSACQPDQPTPEPDDGCVETAWLSGWTVDTLNEDFLLQYPPVYTGPGRRPFEGYTYFKNRPDSSVVFAYAFCGPLFCESYGATLPGAQPDVVTGTAPFGQEVSLPLAYSLCENAQLQGLFYAGGAPRATGLLYLRPSPSDTFRQALFVTYDTAWTQEVNSIIRSLRPY